MSVTEISRQERFLVCHLDELCEKTNKALVMEQTQSDMQTNFVLFSVARTWVQ